MVDYDVYLDGVLVNDWVNWNDFTKEINRNDSLKIFGVRAQGNFTFTGDAYRIIIDKIRTDGPCSLLPAMVIYRGTNSVVMLDGQVFLNTVVYKEEESGVECSLTCEIEDNSFSQFIINNSQAVFKIGDGISLKGNPVTAATPLDLTLFTPSNGLDITEVRKAYDVIDAMTEVVACLTEETVLFESGWYSALPDDEKYAISVGVNLRVLSQLNPEVSFADIMDNLQKKYNLWLFAVKENGVNILKLEEESFITQAATIRLDNVRDITRSFDETKFYSTIEVGSTEFNRDDDFSTNLPFIPLVTVDKETYNLATDCNAGTALDLVSDWTIDHNKIEDTIINSNDENDDQIFMIQYTESTVTATAFSLTTNGGLPKHYNAKLINSEVIDRWRVQGTIGNNFASSIDMFSVQATNDETSTSADSTWDPVTLDDDTSTGRFNDNNRFDIVNYEWEVQETGVYRFSGDLQFEVITVFGGPTLDVFAEVAQRTPTGDDVSITLIGAGSLNVVGQDSVAWQPTFGVYLYKGNIASARGRAVISGGAMTYQFKADNSGDETYFEMEEAFTPVQFTSPQDGDTYFSELIEFEHPFPADSWILMEENPARAIEVYRDSGTASGQVVKHVATAWPKQIKHNFTTGQTTWQLITNPEEVPFS